MKRAGILLLAVLFLAGCSSAGHPMDRGIALRTELLGSKQCSFVCSVTADYGDRMYHFTMDCISDAEGNMEFRVTAPESISGITGRFDGSGGALTFDGNVLAFPLLADEQVIPVSAPWILLKTLRSGYLTSAGLDGDLLRISADDRYEENALHLDIWLDAHNAPVRGEILFRERKILSMDVTDFEIR